MQIAVQYDFIVHQMDVKTAYLNAPVDCELYVDQAEGFEVNVSTLVASTAVVVHLYLRQ